MLLSFKNNVLTKKRKKSQIFVTFAYPLQPHPKPVNLQLFFAF